MFFYRFFRLYQIFTEFYKFYQVLVSFTGFFLVILSFDNVTWASTWFYWVLPGFTEFY